MSNVIEFNGITRLNIDPDKVLEKAKGVLEGVIVIGYDKDGKEYFASSYADGGDICWHLQRAHHRLMRCVDVEDD